MKSFRSVVVLKRPRHELWMIMRDHLADFAGNLADIEAVRQIGRETGSPEVVRIANEWRARQQIPAPLRALLKVEQISWIDRNAWDAATGICSWTIEPNVFAGHIACSGQTTFADAMGGRGTRITFSGELDLKPGLLGALGSLEQTVSGFIETIVTTIIPRNLRAVAEAAAAFEVSYPISAP